ncbi:hypothetical protein [Corynebacterium argentoratense]|uniref:hypothetical protein n=1 Tax=Corynebacterium argentoratense TaxID=42817 RepID=UPI0011835D8D|nr:hypothetical protein [Corynebacterium argentoratense]
MHSTFGHSPKNTRRKMVSLIAATGIAFGSVIAPQSAVAVETCAATTTEIPRAITNVHILADGKETDTFTKGQFVDIKFDWNSPGTTLKAGSFFTIQVPQEYFGSGQKPSRTSPFTRKAAPRLSAAVATDPTAPSPWCSMKRLKAYKTRAVGSALAQSSAVRKTRLARLPR